MSELCGVAHPERPELLCQTPINLSHADHICGNVVWDNDDFEFRIPVSGSPSASKSDMIRLANLANRKSLDGGSGV